MDIGYLVWIECKAPRRAVAHISRNKIAVKRGVRFTEAGHATFNAREGAHDDLVLALALAVFGLTRPQMASNIKVARAR